jgi:hypothetical protein
MYTCTKEDFHYFKEEFQRWQKAYGLSQWDVRFKKRKLEENNAECWADMEGAVALIVLGREVDNKAIINQHAWHEVQELKFWPVRALLVKMGISHEAITEMLHHIINQDMAILIDAGLL